MGLINFSNITDGTSIDANDVNNPLNTIYDEFNGNITNANIAAAAAISGTKLADDSVTGVKINSYRIPYQTRDSNSVASTTGTAIKIEAGWSQVIGNGTATTSQSITFPTAFSTLLGVMAVPFGVTGADSTPATSITDFESSFTANAASVSASSASTTGFTATLTVSSGSLNNTRYYGYSWIAWGL